MTFDYNTLNDLTQQAATRGADLPAQETSLIDTLTSLTNEQVRVNTDTMVARTQADQTASDYMLSNQSVEKRMLKANADPLYDITAFFTGEDSKDDLLAEQQMIAQKVSTLTNNYQAVAVRNQFKQKNLQTQIDNLKTIDAVRSGTTAELSTLMSVYKQGALNRNAIAMDDLDGYNLEQLEDQMRKNTTGYADGLVQMAYWRKVNLNAQVNEQRTRTGGKPAKYTDPQWLNEFSPSVSRNKARIAVAVRAKQDTVAIQGPGGETRVMPIGTIDKWNKENSVNYEALLDAGTYLATKEIKASNTITQLERLLPATLGDAGVQIASKLRIPMGEMTEEQKVGALANLQAGLAEVPLELQTEFTQLTQLRMELSRNQKDRSAKGVSLRAQLQDSITRVGGSLTNKLGQIIVNKYTENKDAFAGAKEFVSLGSIKNATSATAIIQSQAFTSSTLALGAADMNTYYEGSLKLIATSLEDQMRTLYANEQAALPEGASALQFTAWLTQKNTKAPPDEYMMKKAIELNAVKIKTDAYGKIGNLLHAGALRQLALKYKDLPEIVEAVAKMQSGGLLNATLTDAPETSKEIMIQLNKLQTPLQERYPEFKDSLILEYRNAALDQELINSTIDLLKPGNEVVSSVDTLVFRGKIRGAYSKNLRSEFSSELIEKILKRNENIESQDAKVEAVTEATTGRVGDIGNVLNFLNAY